MAFLDIDVSPHPALYDPEGLTRRFKTIGAPRVVRSVTLQDEDDDLVGTSTRSRWRTRAKGWPS
jgi:hypothetical protein